MKWDYSIGITLLASGLIAGVATVWIVFYQPFASDIPIVSTTPRDDISGVLLNNAPDMEPQTSPVPEDIDLAIPFQPQAPKANWSQPYQDACEEAAVILVGRYFSGQSLTAGQMNEEILRLVDWQTKTFGTYKDTNTAETAELLEHFYPNLQAAVKYNVTVEDIKSELQNERPVIVLLNGRKVGNPFYNPPGPIKHALVIRGFTGDNFITNDPGTKRGKGYKYSTSLLFNAMVDYDGIEPGTGKKAMIVVQIQ